MPDLSRRPVGEESHATHMLFEIAETSAREAGTETEVNRLTRLHDRLRDGKTQGTVFRDPGGSLWGIALWEPIGSLGRRVSRILLAAEHQDEFGQTSILSSLLDAPHPSERVLILQTAPPALSAERVSAMLAPYGFREFRRLRMAFRPGTPLPPDSSTPVSDGQIRPLKLADREALARLCSVSYASSIDRFLFATESDPILQAEQRMTELFAGEVGAFVEEASFCYEAGGQVLGATLVTREGSHFLLADVEVHPKLQGQGYARRLIRATLAAVSRDPTTPLILSVTERNRRAVDLYRGMGFVVEGAPVTIWADPARLGLPDPDTELIRRKAL